MGLAQEMENRAKNGITRIYAVKRCFMRKILLKYIIMSSRQNERAILQISA